MLRKCKKTKTFFHEAIASYAIFLALFIGCGKHNLDLENIIPLATLTMTSNIESGTYSAPPNFTLTLNKSEESSKIMYCVNAGASSETHCCNPRLEGQVYSGNTISGTAGSTDGNYCLSYIGFTDTETSSIGRILIEINSSGPDINITTPRRMVQSNQYVDISFSSEELGHSGIFFSLLNYSTNQGTDCEQINSDANFATNGVDLDNDSSPDTLDMASESNSFSTLLRGKHLLQYGDNYLYYALVDSSVDPMRSSCPGINVVLNDFNVFEFSTNGDVVPNGNNEIEFIGGFNSFGGGTFLGSDSSSKLQIGMINIIH